MMITADRTIETLAEKFAQVCSDEYSLKTDRSEQIYDYIMGNTDTFPDMLGKKSHYTYLSTEALMKLGRKDEGDVFFRAGAILIHLESDYRNSWRESAFSLCLGDDAKAYGLAGKTKGNDRMGKVAARLENIRTYAGNSEIVDELKRSLTKMQRHLENQKTNHANNSNDMVEALLLFHAYSGLPGDAKHDAKVQSFNNELPELYRAVLARDASLVRRLLHTLFEPLVVGYAQTKDNRSWQELDQEWLEQKRKAIMANRYPDASTGGKDRVTPSVLQNTLMLACTSLLYLVNVAGGKEAFLDKQDDTGLALLEGLRELHEIYPLEVRHYLLSMDYRAKNTEELLSGLLPVDEPFRLIEQLCTDLYSHYVPWQALQASIAGDPERAKRAFDLSRSAYFRAFIHKVLDDHGVALPPEAGTVEDAVFAALRHPLEAGRHGLNAARYLSGETSLEDYWKDNVNRALFTHLNRNPKRIANLIKITFLPVESEAMRRFAVLLSRPETGTMEALSDLYSSYAFSGQQLLKAHGDDPEVNRDHLLSSLFQLNGMRDYSYRAVPHDEYAQIVEQNLEFAFSQYKSLPADTRLLALDIAFGEGKQLTLEQISSTLRLGLQDSSKKANALAAAKFNRTPDPELYIHVYRNEKKAGIKEMVLNAIRSLEQPQTVYQSLLTSEKSADWKTLIRILMDTAELGPMHAHAALAEQADAKKRSRIGWLSASELPDLTGADGEVLDERIKTYILLQSVDHSAAPNEGLNEVRTYATADSLARFAMELLQVWIQEGAPAKEKWAMYLSALFGDVQLVSIFMRQIKEWTENSRGAIAADAVKVLAYLKEPAALMAIDSIKRSVKNRQVKTAAEEALLLAAEQMGLTAEQLEDRLVSSLGFDEKGTQRLSYGERSFLIKVNTDLQLVVWNEEAGKAVKSLPAPGQKDDPDLASMAKAWFTQLKKDLKTMVNVQMQRLEESLSKQRLWTGEDWKRLFVDNVIMQKFAVGLIWGVYEDGGLTLTFRYMEDGTFNTVDEEEYELDLASRIGLVHPLELEASVIEAWKTQLEDYEIVQPFAQLQRETHAILEEEQDKGEYERLPDAELSPTGFPKALEKYGWIKGQPMDGGWYHEFYKNYGDMKAELTFSGTSISYYEGLEDITLESLIFFKAGKERDYSYYSDRKPIPLGKVPGRVFSETVYDILRAAGR
ncbi:protein of unknown function [Paenibacillus uliginis N3/975]|uniref:DUF4132 domain-containing protein n=1 Tax=Paenibacillus uliginis N3/975 TaxID=1313296 RepID=A0A1X7HE37_9BACL|nr:DUF4132 domain-containing protein [Paenibacillus uliginis]SMF84878.1 protein of unknown function [Paenibacillus uliginis N3/975]